MTENAPEYLTVKELAELLRLKERKVYDLAASGAVPCVKVTGKLLFPEKDIRAWMTAGQSDASSETVGAGRPNVFLGSHDPLLDWAIRQSRCGMASLFDSSLDGLTRFAAREGAAAGLHLLDAETEQWNVPHVQKHCGTQNVVLLGFATRMRGIVIRPEDQSQIQSLTDLSQRRFAPRQPESGTASIFARLCRDTGIDPAGLTQTPAQRSETDAVSMVQHGAADATFGLASLAKAHGLAFIPLIEERFDILVDRRAWFDDPLQKLAEFMRTDEFADYAHRLGGYDISAAGKTRWNA